MLRRKSGRKVPAAGAISLATLLLAACGGGGSGGGSGSAPLNSLGSAPYSPPAVMQAKSENAPVDPAIAPLSVALVLQIAYNGAVGPTQQAMEQTLQLGGLSVSQLNSDNAALQASLLNVGPQVDLTIANSLWVNTNTYTSAPSFE